jgi:hypothetical protein
LVAQSDFGESAETKCVEVERKEVVVSVSVFGLGSGVASLGGGVAALRRVLL